MKKRELIEENNKLKKENVLMHQALENIIDFKEKDHNDGLDMKEIANDALLTIDLNRDEQFLIEILSL